MKLNYFWMTLHIAEFLNDPAFLLGLEELGWGIVGVRTREHGV
jgi:hypothetical protein